MLWNVQPVSQFSIRANYSNFVVILIKEPGGNYNKKIFPMASKIRFIFFEGKKQGWQKAPYDLIDGEDCET